MKISRENYESFFLDYIEGTLDESVMDDFIDFLQQNPDLKQELTLFKPLTVQSENLMFHKKEELFRNRYDLENEFNKAAIALAEGTISEKTKSEFENYLSAHPARIRDFKLFQKTKLIPDETILFAKKPSLYRKKTGKTILMWSIRIAAVFLLAISIFKITENYTSKTVELSSIIKNEIPEINQPQNKSEEKSENKTIKQPAVYQSISIKKQNVAIKVKEESLDNYEKPTQVIDKERDPSLLMPGIEKLRCNLSELPKNPELAKLNQIKPSLVTEPSDERLIVDIVREKAGLKNLSFGQIARSGLNFVSSLSKEKFTYKTDTAGNITQLNLDSRILAFSIPTGN